jgi:hypothetical protein
MSLFRLLPFSLLIAAGVATSAAQSLPENTPSVMQSGQLSSSSSSADRSSPMDRILSGDYTPRLSQFSVPHKFIVDQDGQPTDNLCLTMRTYKVARDDPHSDSTHAAGYSTCTSAARFQMRTTEFRILPAKP